VELSVVGTHTDILSTLPLHHRDPFDRLLVAQALEGSMTIVTKDEQISRYDVSTLA
jgi:PIN domain nuclease of toxin-antitoxin system